MRWRRAIRRTLPAVNLAFEPAAVTATLGMVDLPFLARVC